MLCQSTYFEMHVGNIYYYIPDHIVRTNFLIFRACKEAVFHLYTQSEPVLVGKNKAIKFAPYYTFYPHLERDMGMVGLVPEPNLWNKPIVLGKIIRNKTSFYD